MIFQTPMDSLGVYIMQIVYIRICETRLHNKRLLTTVILNESRIGELYSLRIDDLEMTIRYQRFQLRQQLSGEIYFMMPHETHLIDSHAIGQGRRDAEHKSANNNQSQSSMATIIVIGGYQQGN